MSVSCPFVRVFNYRQSKLEILCLVEFVWTRGGALISIYFRHRGRRILNHTLMLQFKSYNKVLMKLKLAAVAIVGDGGLIYLT